MKSFLIVIVFMLALQSCHTDKSKPQENEVRSVTPVTIASPEKRTISEEIKFKALSAYQKKNTVRSNINGYIENMTFNIGDYIKKGRPMFSVITKEARAIGKSIGKDSLFNFKGESTITAPSSGVVTEVSKQVNDYISDGDQLCVIAEQSSFVFLLNIPFEQNKYAAIGKKCRILLPDSTIINGTITSKLSNVDPVSQTQSYVVTPQLSSLLPENLSVAVQIIKEIKPDAQILTKSCILSDETMQHFWVMKLINDSTAIKVPVTQGMESDSVVEIVTPVFNPGDKIIKTGNYGLPDTALVKIVHP